MAFYKAMSILLYTVEPVNQDVWNKDTCIIHTLSYGPKWWVVILTDLEVWNIMKIYCCLKNYFVWLHDTRKFFCHKISCYGVQELYGILQYTLKVKAELPKKPLKIMYDCSSMSKETAKDTLENGIPNVLGLNPK